MSHQLVKKLMEAREKAVPGEWQVSNANEGMEHAPLWTVCDEEYYNPTDENKPCIQIQVNMGQKEDAEFITLAANSISEIAEYVLKLEAEIEELKKENKIAWNNYNSIDYNHGENK